MAYRQGAGALKPKNFQLLEINIISGQDLQPVSSKMKTYAIAWVHPARKLSSCVDSEGKNNPTWNDKFVFRVNDEFLRKDTSVVMIQIYSVRKWLGDVLVGTVGVLVGNLVPPPARNQTSGMRFVALQVRRPSGRPQGILNIGVALLDSSMRSMPLYRQLSASAVGFRNLMDDQPTLDMLQKNNTNQNPLKPILRRSRSERSEFISSSIIAVGKESSIISISESVDPLIYMKKKGKASSVISGAELREKPKNKGLKNGKASSVLSDSVVSKVSSKFHKIQASDLKNQQDKAVEPKLIANATNNARKDQKPYEEVPKGKFSTGPPPFKGSSILSISEVGPSPSEVAAVMATRKYPLHDNQSSVLDGWSVDESVEGLKSKLERWRTELPTLYDRGYSTSTYRTSSSHHTRKQQQRHSDGGGAGLFSCFGNICGYECQCVCGQPPPERERRGRRYNSPSTLTPGRPYF